MGVYVSIDEVAHAVSHWKAASKAIGKACASATRSTLSFGKSVVRAEAPDRTGELRRSIDSEVTSSSSSGAEGTIFADAPHAAPVIEGARAHEIRGNPLAFEVGGERVFTRRVHHPGNAPNPFADRVAPLIESDLERGVAAGVMAALGEFGG